LKTGSTFSYRAANLHINNYNMAIATYTL